MSSEEKELKGDEEQKTLSCSMTFQNAIEIDFSKLREMAEKENNEMVKEEEDDDNKSPDEFSEEIINDSLSASIVNDGVTSTERDLSIYEKRMLSNDPESSSDEEEERNVKFGDNDIEPETEKENSDGNSDNDDLAMPYEQLGATEFTKQNSEDEDDQSDNEFGDFESCPVSYQTMNDDSDGVGKTDYSCVGNTSGQENDLEACQHKEEYVDNTQDVLGNHHPRTPARAIPPLDEEKIAIIKQTMAGFTLKPPAGAGECVKHNGNHNIVTLSQYNH